MQQILEKILILANQGHEWVGTCAWRIGHFIRLVIYRFMVDGGLHHTATLTYTTLLSLVPLMTVSLALLSAFPIGDRVVNQIQDFVFKNFVPDSGEIIRLHLQQFSEKASRLTGTGSVFLVMVAILLMANIDLAFNSIWHVRHRRNPISKFTVYWSVLTLGPLLIGVSVLLTSSIETLPWIPDIISSLPWVITVATDLRNIGGTAFDLMPIVASSTAFTLLYLMVPNRSVPFTHGLIGGIVAGLLFELTKRGFAFYVTMVPYQAIYGALAAIPVFLIWIYLSWLVTLLGCEITYCLGTYRDTWHPDQVGSGTNILLAYRILAILWSAQNHGKALSMDRLLTVEVTYSETELEYLLMQLVKARLVLRTERGEWALARDLTGVSLLDLYSAGPFVLPVGIAGDQELKPVLEALNKVLEETLDVPLASLYQRRVDSQIP